jgi:hypothetical protein
LVVVLFLSRASCHAITPHCFGGAAPFVLFLSLFSAKKRQIQQYAITWHHRRKPCPRSTFFFQHPLAHVLVMNEGGDNDDLSSIETIFERARQANVAERAAKGLPPLDESIYRASRIQTMTFCTK